MFSGIISFFTLREISFGPLGSVNMSTAHLWALFFDACLGIWITYLLIRLHDLHHEFDHVYEHHFIKAKADVAKNERWEKITKLIRSTNPNDWRVAIIEADSMLDHMLIMLGYNGSSVAEKLSQTTSMQFPTLEYAWEAHKIRNKIAHEGMQYQLDYREALHAYNCFEKVFNDSRFI